jgi:hypothetical protein
MGCIALKRAVMTYLKVLSQHFLVKAIIPMMITIFRDMIPCSLLDNYQLPSVYGMRVGGYSKTLVNVHQKTAIFIITIMRTLNLTFTLMW